MRKIFVIGCTHFGDSRILEYKDRSGKLIRPGFSSIKEMDKMLLDNWNSVVSEQDIVYHLGDVYAGTTDVLEQLNGRKRLVLGNHDNGKDKRLWNVFQKITSDRMFPDSNVLLSHAPRLIPVHGKWEFNVHAHIHQNRSASDYHINVSSEAVNFTPVELGLILAERVEKIEKQEL